MARSLTALNIIPLLVFPLILYNLIRFTSGAPLDTWELFEVGMFSGDIWRVSFGDVFLGLSLLLLFVEIVKATRTDAMSIINHGLSMLLSLTCIIQFIAVSGFSNSVFFFLTLMTVIDVIAGFTVTIIAAKRDFGAPVGIAGTN